jgi:hypothetical protein
MTTTTTVTTAASTPALISIASLVRALRLTVFCGAVMAAPFFAAAGVAASSDGPQGTQEDKLSHDHGAPASAKLVQLVREATRQFLDVNNAIAAGYGPKFGCVTGPQEGAMGVHYINPNFAGDSELDATRPEALIYEINKGRARLVGVEFIVDAALWAKTHGAGDPPVLEGQMFQFVGAPNRYTIPAFYELHVWAWRDNPNGAFVDWNTRVSCEGHDGQ